MVYDNKADLTRIGNRSLITKDDTFTHSRSVHISFSLLLDWHRSYSLCLLSTLLCSFKNSLVFVEMIFIAALDKVLFRLLISYI